MARDLDFGAISATWRWTEKWSDSCKLVTEFVVGARATRWLSNRSLSRPCHGAGRALAQSRAGRAWWTLLGVQRVLPQRGPILELQSRGPGSRAAGAPVGLYRLTCFLLQGVDGHPFDLPRHPGRCVKLLTSARHPGPQVSLRTLRVSAAVSVWRDRLARLLSSGCGAHLPRDLREQCLLLKVGCVGSRRRCGAATAAGSTQGAQQGR